MQTVSPSPACRVSVECVDQLAQRNSDYHADRDSVEYVDQLAQRRSNCHADRVSNCHADGFCVK